VLRTTLRWLALATSTLLTLLAVEALIATITVPDDGYRAPSPAPRAFGTADVKRPRLRYVSATVRRPVAARPTSAASRSPPPAISPRAGR